MIIEDRVVNKPENTIQHTLYDSNNKMILGFVKMLFETTCEKVEGYVDSEMARKYADMLSSGEIDYSLREFIEPHPLIIKAVTDEVKTAFMNYHEEHIIMLSGFKGLGLVGLIKVFDQFYVMILSNDLSFSSTNLIIIYNNFLKKNAEIYSAGKTPQAKINIKIVPGICIELLNSEFLESSQEIKLYDSNGKLLLKSIFDIVNEFKFPRIATGNYKPEFKTIHFVNGRLFVNSKYHGKFLPVDAIELQHVMEQVKIGRS